MEKKSRFGDLVRNSGRPEVVTLWTDPAKDGGFAKAIKEHRVLTVVEQAGGHKDYGLVGFERHPHATYLVFPRPLLATGRVIGINYQLIEEPMVADPVQVKEFKPKIVQAKRRPADRKFTVTIRRSASLEDTIVVKAPDQHAAEERALAAARRKPFHVPGTEVHEEIVHTG